MKIKKQNSTLPARAYPNTPLFESALKHSVTLCTITMKYVLTLLLIVLYFSCWSQDFVITIIPGDNSMEGEVTALLENRTNRLYIEGKTSGIDSYYFETDNGQMENENTSHPSIIPNRVGTGKITALIKLKNGESDTISRTFKVVKYPDLNLRIEDNNLLENGTVQFQLYSNGENVTKDFYTGHFEFELINESKEVIFESGALSQLLFNIYNYDPNLVLKKGQTLKISSMRTLWKTYNVSVYTEELSIEI